MPLRVRRARAIARFAVQNASRASGDCASRSIPRPMRVAAISAWATRVSAVSRRVPESVAALARCPLSQSR